MPFSIYYNLAFLPLIVLTSSAAFRTANQELRALGVGLLRKFATEFGAGETAPMSGLYRVSHDSHRAEHLVVVLKGENFPACRSCRGGVSFHLDQPVDYVAHDWDFTGPNLQLIYSRDRRSKS